MHSYIPLLYHNKSTRKADFIGGGKLKFEFSKVTRSRLMGSIGLHVRWFQNDRSLNQFFLLDSEGEGIVDYIGLWNGSQKKIEREEQRLMGGLGAKKIRLTKKETLTLLYQYGRINIHCHCPFPQPLEEYEYLLKKDITISEDQLFFKICTPIQQAIEFVHYMTMRFVAKDIPMLNYFSYYAQRQYDFLTNDKTTLLRNSVERVGNDTYLSNAIVEEDDGYYRLKLGFRIVYEGRYYFRTILGGRRQKLDMQTAASLLSQSEYLAIFKHKSPNLSEILIEQMPGLYKIAFEKSILYTDFKKNNDHVKKSEYRISGDIQGLYLIKKNELIFGALEEKAFEEGLTRLQKIGQLRLEDEIFSMQSILYEYAQSKSENIYDFVDQKFKK